MSEFWVNSVRTEKRARMRELVIANYEKSKTMTERQFRDLVEDIFIEGFEVAEGWFRQP